MARLLTVLANLFPVWVLIAALLAYVRPDWFTWFQPWIVPGLALIMLGMGITLGIQDFRSAARMPRVLIVGFAAQYLIMPALGWSIARLLKLENEYAAGLILVACCPGGTASNVVAYMARANVALSVLMTMCSTFAAIVLTPLLVHWLAGTYVDVDAFGLFLSTLQVVLLPVVAGICLNRFAPRLVTCVAPAAPLVSVIAIVLICASIIGANVSSLRKAGGVLLAAVFLLHFGGFLIGYLAARISGCDKLSSRTISIEVGMQNSGLGTMLAQKHFSDPLTGIALAAVPCAISATMHSVIGSLLAGLWRMRALVPRSRPPGSCASLKV